MAIVMTDATRGRSYMSPQPGGQTPSNRVTYTALTPDLQCRNFSRAFIVASQTCAMVLLHHKIPKNTLGVQSRSFSLLG